VEFTKGFKETCWSGRWSFGIMSSKIPTQSMITILENKYMTFDEAWWLSKLAQKNSKIPLSLHQSTGTFIPLPSFKSLTWRVRETNLTLPLSPWWSTLNKAPLCWFLCTIALYHHYLRRLAQHTTWLFISRTSQSVYQLFGRRQQNTFCALILYRLFLSIPTLAVLARLDITSW
jgi:hypothetical protein